MKKVFPSNSQCVHVWAQQSQDEGRASGVSFEYGRLFSYRTCIAEFFDNPDSNESTVIFNDYSYSSSTSMHQGLARQAVSGVKKIYIKGFGSRGTHTLKYGQGDFERELVAYNHGLVDELLIKASRARTRSDSYKAEALSIIQSLVDYAEFFGLTYKSENLDALQKSAVEYARFRAESEKQEKEARILEQAENLQKWRNGENANSNFEVTALRVSGENIETSRGAVIPLEHGVKIWPLINKLHATGKTYTKTDRSINLGYFTVESFKNDVLTVGCHQIPFNELEKIAFQLNLKTAA